MCSTFFSLGTHYWVHGTVVALFLIFAVSFTCLLTSILLCFLAIFAAFTKLKPGVKCENISSSLNTSVVEELGEQQKPKEKEVTADKLSQQDDASKIHDYISRSIDLSSENESIDLSSTSEDSDGYWQSGSNMGGLLTCSDDSISDDDSLIEIALPEGHYICPKDETKFKWQPSFPESIFQQEGLTELLAELNEMNEEDNLFEIDISMGSIKCSRLEIKA
ncbi:hypothetical protein IFM89_009400 [Coptis chinensis]|uniref:Uncharacterized protein n=1 Tax=Coptis chinensis TaxID=261450 RepID=A0A835LBK6_9MAGN|nr:hypothetical protein IFM89_009400 [Coptis chinensis]